jgi:hypothetical protein
MRSPGYRILWTVWTSVVSRPRSQFVCLFMVTVAITMTDILNQPIPTRFVIWEQMNVMYVLARILAMLANVLGILFFISLIEERTTSFRAWELLLWGGASFITFLAARQVRLHVTSPGILPSSQVYVPFLIEHVCYFTYLIVLQLTFTYFVRRAYRTAQNVKGKMTYAIFGMGQICAAIYIGFSLGIPIPGYPLSLLTISRYGFQGMLLCYFLALLLPLIVRQDLSLERLQQHVALLIIYWQIRPLWRHITRQAPVVRYIVPSWWTAWRNTDYLRIITYRYILEITNAVQFLLARQRNCTDHREPENSQPVAYREVHFQECASLDAVCCGLIQQTAWTVEEQALLEAFPRFESDEIAEIFTYFDVVAHYYHLSRGSLPLRWLESWRWCFISSLQNNAQHSPAAPQK